MATQPIATTSQSVPNAQNLRAPPLQPITHMSNNRQATPGNDGGQLSDAGDAPGPSSKKRRTAGVRARGRRGRGGAR